MSNTNRQLSRIDAKLEEKADALLELGKRTEGRDPTPREEQSRAALRDDIRSLKTKREKVEADIDVERQVDEAFGGNGETNLVAGDGSGRVRSGGGYSTPGGGGFASPGGDGWQALADGIDISRGVREARVPLGDLLGGARPSASLDANPGPGWDPLGFRTVRAPVAARASDSRYLFPHLATQVIGDGVLSVTDWKQTGTEDVTGDAERDPTASTEKAELNIEISANPEAVNNERQLAKPDCVIARSVSSLAR